ncbi:MAG: GTPase [Candidatus Aminicenantales bacterium]
MPANLPPQYFDTERKLKTARTPQEKVEILEELLSIVPKHKGTEKLQAQLKTKIARLKDEMQKRPASGRHGPSHIIEKRGAGQVIVFGPPNTGKSTLIKSLTGAEPEIGNYPFTTRLPAPYMMKYENIQIQLVDTPPLSADTMESGQIELIKVADGGLLVVDLSDSATPEILEALLAKLKEKRVELVRKDSVPAEDTPVPPFRKRALVIANKKDQDSSGENLKALKFFFDNQLTILPHSAIHGESQNDLKKKIFSFLEIIRVYSKAPGKKPDYEEPFVLRKGSTVMDMARAVHKDFALKLTYVRIWSRSKYDGQMVNRDHVLEDEDVLELHI